MKQFIFRLYSSFFIRIGFAIAISLVSLYLALRNISLQEVGESLRQANYWYVLLALISVGINNLAKTSRWMVLMKPRHQQVNYYQVLKSLLISQSLNNLYPVRIGDISRVYIAKSGTTRTFVLGTVGIEKVIDMLSYAVLFIALIFLIPLPVWISNSGYTLVITSIIITLGIMLITYKRSLVIQFIERSIGLFPKRFQTYTKPRIRAGINSLEVLQNNSDLLRLGLWSVFIWGTALLNNQLVLLTLDIHLPLTASLLILIALIVGISLPSIPGRFGIFEYICVLALGAYGIDQAIGLSYGILLHAIVMLPTTLAGLIFLATSGLTREDINRKTPVSNANALILPESKISSSNTEEGN